MMRRPFMKYIQMQAATVLREYSCNRRFKVVTDCNSLRMTHEKKNLVPRIARWWLKISEYDFELMFRPAYKLAHADALSRCPALEGEESEDVTNKMLIVGLPEEDWLIVMQREDPQIIEIRRILENKNVQKADKSVADNFLLEQGRLFKKTQNGDRFVVPKGVRWRVIKAAHDERGHPGVERTVEA